MAAELEGRAKHRQDALDKGAVVCASKRDHGFGDGGVDLSLAVKAHEHNLCAALLQELDAPDDIGVIQVVDEIDNLRFACFRGRHDRGAEFRLEQKWILNGKKLPMGIPFTGETEATSSFGRFSWPL